MGTTPNEHRPPSGVRFFIPKSGRGSGSILFGNMMYKNGKIEEGRQPIHGGRAPMDEITLKKSQP